jgi:thioredoxin-related protein
MKKAQSKWISSLWIGLITLWFLPAQAGTADPLKNFFEANWGDYSEELNRAKDENKTAIMLFFEMDDCPFCDRMKKTILNQTELQKRFKQDFMAFMVDIEGDVEITNFKGEQVKEKDFAEKEFRVRATPVTIFFSPQGEQLFRYTGPVASVDEFYQMLDYVKSGAYKETSFNRFKRTPKAQ